jgi:hypothetical protein
MEKPLTKFRHKKLKFSIFPSVSDTYENDYFLLHR